MFLVFVVYIDGAALLETKAIKFRFVGAQQVYFGEVIRN